LVALIRRGSTTAFEVLVSRYHARLLAFCRHLLGSREDAEDVLQEVFSAAFNALLDDDRPINVRPWLYRIARNRSLNHLRRIQAVGVDSMDIHLFDHGTTTADRVHDREEFRLLVGDIQALPETQRTALVLREMDALSYEQIAEAMETTVPSVKSLLVRARVSLAEAAQARMLTCEEVRVELGEVAEGLRRRPSPLVRRHLRTCERCAMFKTQLGETSKALTALLPVGGFFLLRKLAILHLGHSAGAGAGSTSGASAAGQAAAVGSTAAAGATALVGSTGGGFLSASVGAIATKAAAGLAAAALVTAGAVEVDQPRSHPRHHAVSTQAAALPAPKPVETTPAAPARVVHVIPHRPPVVKHVHKPAPPASTTATTAHKSVAAKTPGKQTTPAHAKATPKVPPGRTQTQTDATVLAQPTTPTLATAGASTSCPGSSSATVGSTTTTPAPAASPTPDTGSSAAPAGSAPAGTDTTGTQTTGTQTTGTQTTGTEPAADSGATTTTSTSTSAGTASPAPVPATDSSCASDPSGSASAGQDSPSGGVAPYPVPRDRVRAVPSRRHASRTSRVRRGVSRGTRSSVEARHRLRP
jgi:RNA polymerase sigma factor (sigma-70 family)